MRLSVEVSILAKFALTESDQHPRRRKLSSCWQAGPASQRRRTARHDAERACSGGLTHRAACYTQGR